VLGDSRHDWEGLAMIDDAFFRRCRVAVAAGLALTAMLGLAACGKHRDNGSVYTLYQSNPLDLTARVHFATFNSALGREQKDGGQSVNESNCEMAAGVLNESVKRANNGIQKVRYWCEKGKYKADAEAE
jgi:hypothetical protein